MEKSLAGIVENNARKVTAQNHSVLTDGIDLAVVGPVIASAVFAGFWQILGECRE